MSLVIHLFSPGQFQRNIGRGSQPFVGLVNYGNIFPALVRPDLIPGIIRGAVVDDDQLEIAVILAEGAVDGLDEVFGVVVV